MSRYTFLVAAGGTGGHLFPAIAVVERILEIEPYSKIIFTGRNDKIEGEIIPKSGYDFFPIDVEGFHGFSLKSLAVPYKILRAKSKLTKMMREKKVDAVICTGAYIGYAPGIAAKTLKKPLFLLESNVNPGKTISMLSNDASLIFTSFRNSIDYFNPQLKNRIKFTGNPLRKGLEALPERSKSLEKFGLNQGNKTVLIFGGSLGARSINQAVEANLKELVDMDLNIIWQTGKLYDLKGNIPENVRILKFIDDMPSAYSAADLIVSTSGATTVAEIALTAKPSILVPLPSASNNEQFLNAKYFQDNNSSVLVTDADIKTKLTDVIRNLINDDEKLNNFSNSVKILSNPNAAVNVADEILNYMEKYGK